MPSHAAILLAVAPLRDLELDSWTRTPQDYVLMVEERVRLPGYQLWHLSPRGVTTPVGVLLAEESATGRVVLTSQRADAVADLLLAAPGVPDAELPLLFFHLWRDPGRPQELVEGAWSVAREPDRLKIELDVVDRWAGRARWSADLARQGADVHVTRLPEARP